MNVSISGQFSDHKCTSHDEKKCSYRICKFFKMTPSNFLLNVFFLSKINVQCVLYFFFFLDYKAAHTLACLISSSRC
jgi:hypothetical protein